MGRFLLWAAILAGGWLLLQRGGIELLPPWADTGVSETHGQVTVAAGDLDVHYRTQGELREAFMVFGGTEVRHPNAVAHALIAGLPSADARAIASRHPDFHLCRSPGARDAQRHTRQLHVVAATGLARRTVGEALDLHEERVREGGPRTCLEITGAHLQLERALVREHGQDLTDQVQRGFRTGQPVLAREARLVDCQTLLD